MNRTPWYAAAITAAITLLAPAALAGEGTGPGAGKGPRKAMPTFEQMDTNKDGVLTQAELGTAFANRPRMKARLGEMFKRIDGNSNGKLEKSEMNAWKAKRAQWKGRRHGRGPGGEGNRGQGN